MVGKIKVNKVDKLVPNLNNKKNNVGDIRVLDQALKQGLMVKRVHRQVKVE